MATLLLAGVSSVVRGDSEPADGAACGTPEDLLLGAETYHVAPNDTIRALLIFAVFPNAKDGVPCSSDWPTALSVPTWADSIFEDASPWDTAGSVTQYYDLVSQHQHLIRGRVYDQVVELDDTIAEYISSWGADNDAFMRANLDVLKAVVDDLGSDIMDFDLNEDGYLDFAYIFYRSGEDTTGVKLNVGFNAIQRFAPVDTFLVAGGSDTIRVTPYTGATQFALPVDNDGVKQIRSRRYTFEHVVHEYGHLLGAISPRDPYTGLHLPGIGAYGIMDGTYVGFTYPSAFFLDQMAWIEPFEIDSTTGGGDTTIVLSAVPDGGAYARVNTHDEDQYFLLELRNRDLVYAQSPQGVVGCRAFIAGFDGLLVTHVAEKGSFRDEWTNTLAPGLDPEVATGMFTTTGAPDPVAGKDKIRARPHDWDTAASSDLYRPANVTVFAPYTNPSTNLYDPPGFEEPNNPSEQGVYSGIHIDGLEWVGGGNDSMRVHIRYAGSAAPSDADTLEVDTVWDGLVQLTGDLVVPPGVQLTVESDSEIYAKAAGDRFESGDDGDRVELIVKDGTLLAEGESGHPITISSSRDNGFVHWEGESGGEDTAPAAGDWFGIRFDLAGCPSPAYGYLGTLGPMSRIDHSDIKYGRYGTVMENFSAPSLDGVEFHTITDDQHIFLKSDTMIPWGYWEDGICDSLESFFEESPAEWHLSGGTHVVASTTEFNDADWVGEPDKNDLVACGPLFTDGSTAEADSVYFRPDDVTPIGDPTAGSDWGGITLNDTAAGSLIRFADIGYANIPLVVSYADGLTGIERSRVHHFADTGVWFRGSLGQGGFIGSCVVDRGATLFHTLGNTGIYVDQADETNVLNTQVLLHGYDDEGGATGISMSYGKTFCEEVPPVERTAVVANNFVMGPGPDVPGLYYYGIHLNWVCGNDDRDIDLTENWAEDWKFAGFNFVQTADVQINCNRVVQSERGVDIFRDSEPTGNALRFKKNVVEAMTADTTLFALRTTDAVKTKLGPAQVDRGDNWFVVNVEKTKLIYENDSGSADTLDARDNYWKADTLLADSTEIRNRFAPSGHLIKLTGFRDEEVDLGCGATRPSDAPADSAFSSALAGRRLGRLTETRSATLSTGAADLPLVLELGRPFPNPGTDGSTVVLAVPEDRIGSFSLEVFDIGGRRILESRREIAAPGRYPVNWSGHDEAGRRVAAGVYFLRLRGPAGFVEMRKITVLR